MGQKQAGFRIYHTGNLSNFTQDTVEAHEAIRSNVNDKVPGTVGGPDRRDARYLR